MSPTAQTMPLGIEGFTYADLYAPARLKELYDRFCRDVAAADPAFATNVDRAAFAVVTTPTDLASGVVAKLRDGVFGDGFFADWRETYNEGACAQAGGVATNAETTLDGRTVYVTTCAGGLLVYHAYLEEQDVIVSLFSLGEGHYGERLVRGLRP